jgi:hypothetical protein
LRTVANANSAISRRRWGSTTLRSERHPRARTPSITAHNAVTALSGCNDGVKLLSATLPPRAHRQICPPTRRSCWRRFLTLGLVRGFDDVPTVAANYVNFRNRGLVAPIGGAVPGPAHHRGKVDPPALLRNALLHAELTRESENCRGGHRVRTPSSAQVAATLLDTIFEKAQKMSVLKLDVHFSSDLANVWPIGHFK